MKFLNHLLVANPNKWVDDALNCKKNNKNQLKSISKSIKFRFSKYNEIILNRKKPNKSRLSKYKDLLVSYYEDSPIILKNNLSKRRNEHDLRECPYCGKPTVPDTLDHFMPKEFWPEQSFNPNNLVPQCRSCAPIKGKKYYSNELDECAFIHPIYFDALSKYRFKIEITYINVTETPTFRPILLKPTSIPTPDHKRILSHFSSLKIKERMISYCILEYSKWKNIIKQDNFDLSIALSQRLTERTTGELGKDWMTALYQALLSKPEIVEFLNNQNRVTTVVEISEPDEEIEL